MIDLGRKPEKCTAMPVESKMSHSINYPSFYVSNIDLGLDEKDVGKVITIPCKLKISSVSKRINTNKYEEGTKKTEDYNFDVMGMDLSIRKPNEKWSIEDIAKYRKDNPDDE